ncbi:rubrerythrin-like domain-containing protein [Natrialbaceae archaeon A-arb3/5]
MAPQLEPEYDPAGPSEYECLNCGAVVTVETPSGCPTCNGTLRNRAFPME